MNLREALDIVLQLAQDNAIDSKPGYGNELIVEAQRQEEAVDKVHKLLDILSEG